MRADVSVVAQLLTADAGDSSEGAEPRVHVGFFTVTLGSLAPYIVPNVPETFGANSRWSLMLQQTQGTR